MPPEFSTYFFKSIAAAAALSGFIFSTLTWAQETISDTDLSNSPLKIEADRAELDEQKGSSVYIGNVALIRGGLKMLGERLVIKRDESSDTVIATLTGQPARAIRDATADSEAIDATAKSIEYNTAQRLLSLSGSAVINRGQSSMKGESIRYELDKSRIEAGGDGRVSFTIDMPAATEPSGQ